MIEEDVVRARKFVLVDDAGNSLAEIQAIEEEDHVGFGLQASGTASG